MEGTNPTSVDVFADVSVSTPSSKEGMTIGGLLIVTLCAGWLATKIADNVVTIGIKLKTLRAK